MAFRELILSNFRRKLFAFLLAILVWFTIHFADKRSRAAEQKPPAAQTNSVSKP